MKLFRRRRRRAEPTRGDVEREIRSLGWWYQHFELPNGVWTGDGKPPAYAPRDRWNAFAPYLPEDLSGKTALDVGGNSGFFSIQMALRGAEPVLVEPFKEFTDQASFAADQFGVELDVVNADVHTYCLTIEERFDYVLFLGLVYHLKYPGLVLDRLAEMTRERLVLQSHSTGVADTSDQPELPEAEDALGDPDYPRLSFVEHRYKNDPTNWWIPNHRALPPLIRSAGLKIVAQPSAEIIVAEQDRYLGKVVYDKLVFPRYGKPGEAVYPGQDRLDPALWRQLNEP